MSARLKLRSYQQACVDAHFWYFENASGNPLFVVPTGGGKSLIIAEFIREALRRFPDTRFMVATHVKELIEQNHDEFVRQWGGNFLECPAGIYSAGAGRRDVDDAVIFAGVQSVAHRAAVFGHIDLLLVDEAHLVPKSGQGRYLTLIEELRRANPKIKVCGYTATHYRLSGGFLHKGDDRIFTDVAYEVKVETLIEEGHLAPLVALDVEHVIDTTDVASSRGDYVAAQLSEAATVGDRVELAVNEAVDIAQDDGRKSWLFFATSVKHAGMIRDRLVERDVSVACIFGDTPKSEREQTVEAFKAGEITALVNVGVLTTGFNAPRCDMMAVMRPTQSASLYVQMMGRGMRTFPGKANCLVLDYGQNVERHGPINRVQPRQPKPTSDSEVSEAPSKRCPECGHLAVLATPWCGKCGYEWPKSEPSVTHDTSASNLSPIDLGPEKRVARKVIETTYARHKKDGSPDSLLVEYDIGVRVVREWVCLEHQGFPRRKAAAWWFKRSTSTPPMTIDDALDVVGELKKPFAIVVVKEGKYDRVQTAFFDEEDIPEDVDLMAPRLPSTGVGHQLPFTEDIKPEDVPF